MYLINQIQGTVTFIRFVTVHPRDSLISYILFQTPAYTMRMLLLELLIESREMF